MKSLFMTALMLGLFCGGSPPGQAQDQGNTPTTVVINTSPGFVPQTPTTATPREGGRYETTRREPPPKRAAESIHFFDFLTALGNLAYGVAGGLAASLILATLCMNSCSCWRAPK